MASLFKDIFTSFFILPMVLLWGFASSPAWAVSALDLKVYPPTAYLAVKPGAGVTHQVKVKNDGLYTLELTPVLVDFQGDGVQGKVILQQNSSFTYLNLDGDPSKWGKSLVIKPGEEKNLNFVIAMPSNAESAEHYLSILFQAKQLSYNSLANQQSVIAGIIASNVVLTVSDDELNRGQLVIEHLSVPQFADSFVGFAFSAVAKNIGYNASPISGQFRVSHWPSPKVDTYELYPDMVLADNTRLVRAMSEAELAEIDELEASRDILQAAGTDVDAQKNALINQYLSSNLFYKRPLMLGAYDVTLQLGDEVMQKRVIVLPFSVLVIALLLPPLYWLVRILRKN